KKVTGLIKLQIKAGAANPAPPIGPALGQHGVNIMEFCKAYNAATESQRGNVIPVEITVYEDRTFTFVLKTPPAAELIKKAAGVALKLGVDVRKADQIVRGTVSLPHGTGKTARVIVFAVGPAAEAAIAAGADEVGGDELIAKVAGGYTSFDAAVATPDMMGKV